MLMNLPFESMSRTMSVCSGFSSSCLVPASFSWVRGSVDDSLEVVVCVLGDAAEGGCSLRLEGAEGSVCWMDGVAMLVGKGGFRWLDGAIEGVGWLEVISCKMVGASEGGWV